MEAGFIAIVVIMTTIGVIVGIYIERNRANHKITQGTIKFYYDPEDGLYPFLESRVPIADIASRKQVLFDVDSNPINSHE